MQEFGTRIWAGTLLLQCIWLARGIAFCCRTFGTSSEQILEARLRAQKWWAVICPQMDHRLIEKVDAAKCRMTRLVWILLTAGSMFRLTLQQLMLAIGRERISPHFDLQLFFFATVGLVVSLKPNLITPRSLDLFYVATSLLSILALLPASNIMDAREFMSLSKKAEFFLAALTKYAWPYAFSTFVHFLYAMRLTRLHADSEMPVSPQFIALFFLLCFVGITATRRVIIYNIRLKMDLTERSVELGAVSSLLLVCYDAVLELDESLTLTEDSHDSRRLSSMLLHSGSRVSLPGMADRSFLDCFDPEDQDRIKAHFANSSDDAPVMALNADMLDADQNRVKVEVFHAQFRNLYNERRFLIGVREIQDVEQVAPLLEEGPLVTRDENLVVVFEVQTFDILFFSQGMNQFCSEFGINRPRSILDLSSDQSRYSFCNRLQEVVDCGDQAQPAQLSFNLLAHGEVSTSLSVEHDELLDCLVASIEIHLPREAPESPELLTEANLQRFGASDGFRGLTSQQRTVTSRSRRSRSRSSRSRTSSRRARHLRSAGTPRLLQL